MGNNIIKVQINNYIMSDEASVLMCMRMIIVGFGERFTSKYCCTV